MIGRFRHIHFNEDGTIDFGIILDDGTYTMAKNCRPKIDEPKD